MTASKPTIFVLDDDPAFRDSMAHMLQGMNLPAEFYATVREFLEVYDPSKPGCLLLDIWMPGNGFSLLMELSARESRLPIIVITGHGDVETKQRALKLGAVAFFEKPFNAGKLSKCILEALEL